MKAIIKEDSIGFLYQNGLFKKMLSPGIFNYYSFLKQTIKIVKAKGLIDTQELDINALKKDETFLKSIIEINVPDSFIGLYFVNNKLMQILRPGEFACWNIFETNTFVLIDTTEIYVDDIHMKYIRSIPEMYYQQVNVLAGNVGLLYFNNKYEKTLDSGTYYFWKNPVNVSVKQYNLKIQQLNVQGQEILTSDRVSLRLNLFCDYKIVDAVKLDSEVNNIDTQLYSLVQISFREYVSSFKLDEILTQKDSISKNVLEDLKERAKLLHIDVISCGIKDIILPGEIRDIMNTVLIAEKKAQANIILRREETASTRSLLNTAKLMEENPTLFKLKEMEYVEKICESVGNISLSSNGNLLSQLNELLVKQNSDISRSAK